MDLTFEDARIAYVNARDDERPIAAIVVQLLRGWANQIAARFNAPVYLVGSALREARPRDIDVRVVLSDEQFVGRYGIAATAPYHLGLNDGGEPLRLFWRDVAKLGDWCARHHGLNIDFQIQSDALAGKYSGMQRLRIDTLDVPVEPEQP